MHRTKVRVVEDALDANNTIARANRDDFDRHDVTVVNLMSAPGAGKTTLLERALGLAAGRRPRRRARGRRPGLVRRRPARRRCTSRSPSSTPTPGFGGECHLDANMVRSALPALPLDEIDLLVIENVGNLVCPAEFRVGEDVRAMVCSVTEGEDKPLKYPLMFRTCELVRRQQDRPAAAPRLRPRQVPLPPRPGQPGRRADARQRAHRRGRRGVARLAAGRRALERARACVSRAPASPSRAAGAARERTGATARFFGAEAERLARLCHLMAERFARGGRLIAFGARRPRARTRATSRSSSCTR